MNMAGADARWRRKAGLGEVGRSGFGLRCDGEDVRGGEKKTLVISSTEESAHVNSGSTIGEGIVQSGQVQIEKPSRNGGDPSLVEIVSSNLTDTNDVSVTEDTSPSSSTSRGSTRPRLLVIGGASNPAEGRANISAPGEPYEISSCVVTTILGTSTPLKDWSYTSISNIRWLVSDPDLELLSRYEEIPRIEIIEGGLGTIVKAPGVMCAVHISVCDLVVRPLCTKTSSLSNGSMAFNSFEIAISSARGSKASFDPSV